MPPWMMMGKVVDVLNVAFPLQSDDGCAGQRRTPVLDETLCQEERYGNQ